MVMNELLIAIENGFGGRPDRGAGPSTAAARGPAAMRVVYGSGMKYDATVPTERTITTM
jgi:hypothetical protein